MKEFNLQRFLSVARWDLSINSQFYTRSALLIVAIVCMPVVWFHLYAFFMDISMPESIKLTWVFAQAMVWINSACCIIASGYMFHNLLTKQGRISELTLPATNLERFLWHAIVTVIGVRVACLAGDLIADLMNAVFIQRIPGAESKSITVAMFGIGWDDCHSREGIAFNLFILLMCLCYIRSFSLFNAWKYRHNIPLTFIFYFLMVILLPIPIALVSDYFSDVENRETFKRIGLWLDEVGLVPILICMIAFAALLYTAIWLLTYRLYKRAQLTTKRNP